MIKQSNAVSQKAVTVAQGAPAPAENQIATPTAINFSRFDESVAENGMLSEDSISGSNLRYLNIVQANSQAITEKIHAGEFVINEDESSHKTLYGAAIFGLTTLVGMVEGPKTVCRIPSVLVDASRLESSGQRGKYVCSAIADGATYTNELCLLLAVAETKEALLNGDYDVVVYTPTWLSKAAASNMIKSRGLIFEMTSALKKTKYGMSYALKTVAAGTDVIDLSSTPMAMSEFAEGITFVNEHDFLLQATN